MRKLDEVAALYGVAPRRVHRADRRPPLRSAAGEEMPAVYPVTGEHYGTLIGDDVATVAAAVEATRTPARGVPGRA